MTPALSLLAVSICHTTAIAMSNDDSCVVTHYTIPLLLLLLLLLRLPFSVKPVVTSSLHAVACNISNFSVALFTFWLF
jgi:ABC-type sulfate transport system permease subunit